MNTTRFDHIALCLEGHHPLEILRWAADCFAPRLTFATGFGVEGCVLIDLIGRHQLPIDLFTLDTGLLFPETYQLWRQLEKRYDIAIRGVQPAWTVEEQAQHAGAELWKSNATRCCELRKLTPLRAALQGFTAWITAIRRDQTPDRATAVVVEPDPKFGLVKVNPLVAWTSTDVWTYVHEHDVPYNPLHERGYPSIGCWPCTTSVAPGEDPRAGRWRGQEKTECGLHTRWATGQKKDLAAQLLDLDEEIQWRRNAYLRNFWQQAQRALGFAMEGFEVLYDAWRREVLAYLLDIPASQLPPLISINDCIKRSTGPWYVGSLLRSCSPTGGRYQEKQGKQSRRCWQWLA